MIILDDAGEVSAGEVTEIKVTKRVINPSVDISVEGRKLWERIHTEPTAEVLQEIERELWRFGCGCDTFYANYKAKHLFPAEADEETRFAWTVELHDAVNAKLAKPVFGIEKARNRWLVNHCDQCGLCCRELSIQFTEADRQREPGLPILMPEKGCPMIGEDNRCGCYETRPELCRRWPAGGSQCNLLRTLWGLARIEPQE